MSLIDGEEEPLLLYLFVVGLFFSNGNVPSVGGGEVENVSKFPYVSSPFRNITFFPL